MEVNFSRNRMQCTSVIGGSKVQERSRKGGWEGNPGELVGCHYK